MENLSEMWHNAPAIIKLPLDFIIYVILIRGVLGNDITGWLKQRGIVKDSKDSYTWKILDFAYNAMLTLKEVLRKFFISTYRKEIIWEHQIEHHDTSLKVCHLGKCQQLDTL